MSYDAINMFPFHMAWPLNCGTTIPFLCVACMTQVDGKMLSQSSAMERYVAKLTDAYSSDP